MIDNKDKNDIVPTGSRELAVYSSELVQRGLVLAKNIKRVKHPIGKFKWRIKAKKIDKIVISEGIVCFIHNSNEEEKMYLTAVEVIEGREKWMIRIDKKWPSKAIIIGVSDGIVCYAVGGDEEPESQDATAQTVDLKMGKLLWVKRKYSWFNPNKIINDSVIFEDQMGVLTAVDIKSGITKWSFKRKREMCSGIAYDRENIYFFWDVGRYLIALDKETGAKKWISLITKVIGLTLRDVYGPIIDEKVICFSTENGFLQAVDTRNGQKRWKIRKEKGIIPLLSCNGLIYCGMKEEGGMYTKYLFAIDNETGMEKWKVNINHYAIPNIFQEVICCGTLDGYIYAFNIKAGTKKWLFKIEGNLYRPPTTVNGVVYCISSTGYLYAIDAITGKENWRFKPDGKITSKIAVGDGVICFGSDDGYLYAIE